MNLYDLGFETFNPILNAGGMYVLFMVAVLLMSIIVIVKCITIKPILRLFKKPSQNEGGENGSIEPEING